MTMNKKRIFALVLAMICMMAVAQAETYVHDEWGYVVSHNYSVSPAPMIEYDQWGNITKQYVQFFDSDLLMYEEYAYDEAGNLLMKGVGRADGTAYGNEYVYDENGNVVKEIVHSWDGTVTEYLNEYDETGMRVKRTQIDQDGSTTDYTYEYDEHGNVVFVIGSDGSVIEYTNEYDAQGRLLSFVSSSGAGETYEYREDGGYKVTYASGAIEEYDSDGILKVSCTSDGLSTSTYDDRGNVLTESTPDNNQEQRWEYSEDGRLLRHYAYLGDAVHTFEYDADGYLLKASSEAPAPYMDVILEYSRSGMVIRDTCKNDDEFLWCHEFREDGTVSFYRQSDWYSIHKQDGRIIKQVGNEGWYEVFRYDENDILLGTAGYDAEGNYDPGRSHENFSLMEENNRESIALAYDQDHVYILCWSDEDENGNSDLSQVIAYEYDEEGNILSRKTLTAEEYESVR